MDIKLNDFQNPKENSFSYFDSSMEVKSYNYDIIWQDKNLFDYRLINGNYY